MQDKDLKIVFMGTPEFAVASLSSIIDHGYNVVGVVTSVDKPQGRGLKVNVSDVKKYALERELPILQPLSLKDPHFIEELESLQADLFIVVAFRMLPEVVWSMPRFGTFNLHASLLPKYRGAAPINWAIINGEKETGVTTFMLDKQIDTGNIILQQTLTISDDETTGTLHDKLKEVGSALVIRTIDSILKGEVNTTPQEDLIGEVKLPIAPKLNKDICRIVWSKEVSTVFNHIRGLSPYPAAFSKIVKPGFESDVKIYGCHIDDRLVATECEPGEIVSDNKSYLSIRCSDGFLSIDELQLAGKKALKIKEFLAGFREIESYHFV